MNSDKIKKLMELSRSLTGSNLWSDMLTQLEGQNILKDHPFFSNPQESAREYPAADVILNRDEMVVLVDLPGVRKEDVQLSIDGEQIVIQGTVKKFFPQGKPVSTERFQGEFHRSIRLPYRIEPGSVKIAATFDEGLLTIRIPGKWVERRSIPIE